ncbi:MAG: TadE/TadG family type IV pilus assembly protein [Gaiellaceae bacterium]
MAEGALRGHPVTGPALERHPRPRGRLRALRREERGTALVEFALIAPLLFLLLFGIIDFGRALNYYNEVTQLAGQGARAAAVNRNPDGTPITSGSSLQNQLVTKYTAQPELKNGEIVCITQLPKVVGDPVTVKVSYQFHFLPLVGAAAHALGGLTLSATQTERAEAVPPSYALGDQSGQSCS